MRRKLKYTLHIVIISSLSLLFLNNCSQNTAEQALRLLLADFVRSIESKQHLAVTQKFTRHFIGNKRFNQNAMSVLIFRYYLRHKTIKIYTVVRSIKMSTSKTEAQMQFHALLTSTKNTLPEHMRTFKISAHWVNINDQWKINKANWIEVRAQSIYPKISFD